MTRPGHDGGAAATSPGRDRNATGTRPEGAEAEAAVECEVAVAAGLGLFAPQLPSRLVAAASGASSWAVVAAAAELFEELLFRTYGAHLIAPTFSSGRRTQESAHNDHFIAFHVAGGL